MKEENEIVVFKGVTLKDDLLKIFQEYSFKYDIFYLLMNGSRHGIQLSDYNCDYDEMVYTYRRNNHQSIFICGDLLSMTYLCLIFIF